MHERLITLAKARRILSNPDLVHYDMAHGALRLQIPDGKLLSGVTVLSRALARLGQRVGARLLARTTRSLSLTDERRRFYEQVGPHLAGIEEAAIGAAGSGSKVRGRLRVNIDPFFSRIILSRHLAAFLARYPGLSVELIMRDSLGDLVTDGFDLALRFGEPPQGSFVARKLIETGVLTVASPSYIKAEGKPRHPKELEERDCIDFYDAANARPYDWEMRCKKDVLPLRVKARLLVSDAGTLIGACEAGAGIVQVLEIGSQQSLHSGRLIELFPEWSDERFPLYAIYPSRLHRAAKVRAFIEFCLEIMDG